ncbi:MAG: TonB-dependent receptor [Ignavibacteria bacterium]|nr:TonB-dependent receptor [Ignavibacteria bacterium]MBI3765501.1 TonB-dependent receptor [Ignavibacteriales bacterium]
MKRSCKIAWLVLLLLSLLETTAYAGTTGKISGQVVDKESREPLIGANIIVEETPYGGVSDIEGNYTILNVPPGTYAVKISMVGYAPLVVSDVRVYIDQTTKVNVELQPQAVEVGEIVIIAERKLVREDVATSVTSFNNDEIKVLPVASVTEVVGLQAGVEQGLVIRGGAADQSLFLLDGVTLRDPRNNQPISNVPLSSVKEVSIERGGFKAEYGQLQSGIINVVTKEGRSDKYQASFTVRYRPPGKKYFGISPYNPNSMWLRPFLDPAVAWTGTEHGGWDYYTQLQYPFFEGWNSLSEKSLSNDNPSDDLSPAAAQRLFMWQHRKRERTDQSDYNIDGGFGGPVPFIGQSLGDLRFFLSYRNNREMLLVPLTRDDYYEDDWVLKLSSDLGSGEKLGISGTLGRSYNIAVNGTEQATSTAYLRTPDQVTQNLSALAFNDSRIFLDSYYSLADVTQRSIAGVFTNVVNPSAFYEVRLEHVRRGYETNPTRLRDTTRNVELFPGFFVNEAPFGWSPQPDVGVDGMLMGGHTSTARDHTTISSTTLKGNLTAQVNANNEIRTGLEFVYNDLNIDYGIVNLFFPESNNYVRQHDFPLRGAMYLQDKLEYKGFIANLGGRLDYLNANTDWPDVNAFDRSFYSSRYSPENSYPMLKAKSQLSLSPRLGISHPITENSKLYFNYGHFRELPTYEQLLRSSRNTVGKLQNIGDPNLVMAKTIAYELGYDHSLFDTYLLQLAGFYRDITDLQGFTTYFSDRGGIGYTKANNDGYQDIRGFEVTLRKVVGSWWRGFANYTYQVVINGRFNRGQVTDNPHANRDYDDDTRNAYVLRPVSQPYARLNVSFFTPADFGPTVLDHQILGNWDLNIIGDWRSGGMTKWPFQILYENVKMVDWLNFNLRLTKLVAFGQMKVTLLMDVNNLLNTKRLNLNSFYDGNDKEFYYESLHLPSSTEYDNIPGDDKVGNYRDDGVAFQPIEQILVLPGGPPLHPEAIFYEKSTGRYMEYKNNAWSEVDGARMKEILDTKAYIDMPNMSSFNFLNPRSVFFGITASFEF